MIAIFKYENGLKFTGLVAESEEKAWEFLDEKYGREVYGIKYGCNHEAFCLKKVEVVG